MRWWHRSGAWPAVALLAAATTGCTAGAPGRACTEIGSVAGVSVVVEREVAAGAPTLDLTICQSDCVEAAVPLEPGAVTVGETCSPGGPDGSCSASSSPDGTLVGFIDVPSLTVGEVRVRGELTTAGSTTALDEITVAAEATYPNGRDCPAGGPQAVLRVTATGLR